MTKIGFSMIKMTDDSNQKSKNAYLKPENAWKRRTSKSKKDLERVERNKKLSHDAFSIINTKFSEE